MSDTATKTAPSPVEPGAPPPVPEERGVSRWIPALGVVVVWIVIYSFTKGNDTLALPGRRAHRPARVADRVQQPAARQP